MFELMDYNLTLKLFVFLTYVSVQIFRVKKVKFLNIAKPSDKYALLKIDFLISLSKHMLWLLKRTISMRWFF